MRWAERDWENRRDAFAADTLAWAYLRNKRPDEAWGILEPVVRMGGEPFLLLHAAQIQFALGRAAGAGRFLDQALACPLRLTPAEQVLDEQTRAQLR